MLRVGINVCKVPQADILPRAGGALELPTDLGSLLDEGLPSSVTTFRNTGVNYQCPLAERQRKEPENRLRSLGRGYASVASWENHLH